MPPIDIILLPTDFSPSSECALAYACELADVHGAAPHLLHVIEDPFTGGACMMVAPPEGHFEHLEQQLRAKLTSLLSAEQQHKYAAVFATRMGQPATDPQLRSGARRD